MQLIVSTLQLKRYACIQHAFEWKDRRRGSLPPLHANLDKKKNKKEEEVEKQQALRRAHC